MDIGQLMSFLNQGKVQMPEQQLMNPTSLLPKPTQPNQLQIEAARAKRKETAIGQVLENLDPQLDAMMNEEGIDPQRKQQIQAARALFANPETSDTGQQMLSDLMKQRGALLSKKKWRDYELDNPLKTADQLNYELYSSFGTEMERQRFRDATRNRDLKDMGTYWFDPYTKERYQKDIYGKTLEEAKAKADMKVLGEYRQNMTTKNDLIRDIDTMLGSIKRLHDEVDWHNTGIFGALRVLPGTSARDWHNDLQSLDAQTVIATMIELKSKSATGATGFGAVNMKELETMQNRWGVVDQLVSEGKIKEALELRQELILQLRNTAITAAEDEQKWYDSNKDILGRTAWDGKFEAPKQPPLIGKRAMTAQQRIDAARKEIERRKQGANQ